MSSTDFWHHRCVTSEWGFLRVEAREVPDGARCATCSKPVKPNPKAAIDSPSRYALRDR